MKMIWASKASIGRKRGERDHMGGTWREKEAFGLKKETEWKRKDKKGRREERTCEKG